MKSNRKDTNKWFSDKTIRLRWIVGVIFLFAFLLYANTLHHLYAIDDNTAIYNNKFVKAGMQRLPELLTNPFYYGTAEEKGDNSLYRPFTSLSFATEIALFGQNPFKAHHFTNIFLFAISAVFLFLLLSRLFQNQNQYIPIIATLLYVAHPIHTEVVANIKSRDEIFSFLFGLILTLYTLFNYEESKKRKYLFMSWAAFFIGIFSKENTITFLAVIPLTLYFFTDHPFKKILTLTLPYLLIAAVYLITRTICIGDLPQPEPDIIQNTLMGADNWIERYATAMFIMLKYLWLLIFSHPLVWDYSYNQIPFVTFSNIWVIISILVHLSLLGFALLNVRKKNIFAYCILFYFITISISSNLIILTGSTMGERFLFTPSLGFCLAVSLLLMLFFKIGVKQKITQPLALTVAVILIFYSLKTYSRNKDWKDTLTVSESDIRHSPNSVRVNHTLASVYMTLSKGEQNKMIREEFYRKIIHLSNKVISIYPDREKVFYYNLGAAHYNLNNFEEAEKAFQHQVSLYSKEVYPNDAKAYKLIAATYYFRKDYQTTILYLKKSVEQEPKDKESYYTIGEMYMDNLKDTVQALPYFLSAVEIDSTYFPPYTRIADIYYQKKEYPKALYYYTKASSLNPSNTSLLKRIGGIYLQLGNSKKAIEYFQKLDAQNK